MILISLTFPAGRYHATPWGRHVNEGAVEWPPSPWRLLRALIATWKRTLPELPQEQVEPILRALAKSAPTFFLPPASTGHTRHYMPWFKKGPDDRTLAFDTFVVIPRDASIIVRWSEASLDDDQCGALGAILQNLNTLGRAESWCEARLSSEAKSKSPNGYMIVAPLNGAGPGEQREIVRLLCPAPDGAFAEDRVVETKTKTTGRGKNKQTVEERTTIYDPAWNICMETLQLHKERWSDPPGSRWVQYARPRECFTVAPTAPRRRRASTRPAPQVVRYALDSAVLPLVTETLPVAEGARRALMSVHGRLTEHDGQRGRSDALSGKGEDGSPLQGHRHAYYLPTDEDCDGRLDHFTLVARDGFGPDEMRAIHRLREIRPRGRDNASHPLRVVLLGYGRLDEYQPLPLEPSREWVSATPYIATRHAKTRGRDRINLTSQSSRSEFLIKDLQGQLVAVLPDLKSEVLEQVEIFPVPGDGPFRLPGRFRPLQFKRRRSKRGDDADRLLVGAFHLRFRERVPGPVAVGRNAHFGMGLFLPDTRAAK